MKLIQIALNRSAHGLFLKDSDTLNMSYTRDGGVTIEHNNKKYEYGFLMWPHYEFKNQIGYLTRKLMLAGKGVNWAEGNGQYSNNTIEFKPCQKMIQLAKDLQSMEDVKGTIGGMRLMGIISKAKNNFLGGKTTVYEMTAAFSGHYVSGSYIHDWQAANTYMPALAKKFPDLNFEWLGYDSSNSHAYYFKFFFTA